MRLRPLKRQIADWLVAQAIFLLMRAVSLLPMAKAIQFGSWFGRIVLRPLSPASHVAQENLRRAFPDLSEADRERILHECWDNLGRIAVEYLYIDGFIGEEWGNSSIRHTIELEGHEALQRLMQNDGPAIIASAHLANWEIPAACATAAGVPLSILYRPPNNKFIADKLLDIRRETMGKLIPSRAGSSLALSSVLEQGGKVGIMVDQHFGQGVVTSFFGRPAMTNPILGILARRFDCPVYAARCIRLPQGRFRLELTGPIEMPRDEAGAVDVNAAMQAVTDIIEEWIREHPGQWLWIHRRWRAPSR